MPIECLISFDNNPQGVYYAGHELSGVVDLRVDTTKRIKAIHITVSGYAKVRWIKKGYPRDSERAMCRAYRSYLSSRSYVLGTCASNSIIDWTAGEYSYTFHVILPENLPTSFDGKYGQIHYEIITTIDRQARYAKIFKLPFTVIHPLDLNADAMYRVPLEILNRKRFWSFCCPTGPLTVKFSTPYCGYAPGQKIHFVLYINNESSIDVTACEVKLKQEVIYESHDPQHEYRYDKHLIARKQFGNVLRWSRKVYRGYLDLPSIPPSSARMIGSCPIMVNYAIKIIVNPTEFHWKMKLKVPLTIGSIPIMDSQLAVNEAYLDDTMRRHARLAQEQHQHQDQPEDQRQHLANDNYNNNNNNNNNNTSVGRHSPNVQPPQIRSNPQTIQRQTTSSTPTILVTDGDNPPDYVAMMPPSYEDAMALSDKFFDDTEFLQNISLSSITSNTKPEPYKPRYPVYYEYETPTIPPELLYDETPAQLRIALEIESTTTVTEDGTESIDINSSAVNLSILRNFEKL